MLPERLSTDLTSLNEGEDRPAVVVDMTMNGEGEIRSAEVYLATVHNHAKLAYPSVGAWLEGVGASAAEAEGGDRDSKRTCASRTPRRARSRSRGTGAAR